MPQSLVHIALGDEYLINSPPCTESLNNRVAALYYVIF